MPTLRRYCRVSKYTVLECRIYLDNPADLSSWLLAPRHNVLPRIFESIRPLVLPKLREETERGKKKAVKDVVVEDDFEVSLFLTNAGTRHTVISKRKTFRTAPPRILSTSSRLTGGRESVTVEIRQESSPEMSLANIPAIVVPDSDGEPEPEVRATRSKSKKRKSPAPDTDDGGSGDSDADAGRDPPPPKRIAIRDEDGYEEEDDKKKLGLETEYEGFNIYSRILCIVVKRRGPTATRRAGPVAKGEGGQRGRVMEEWISMSQAIADGDGEGSEV